MRSRPSATHLTALAFVLTGCLVMPGGAAAQTTAPPAVTSMVQGATQTVVNFADGSTRIFTPAQGANIAKHVAGGASLYGQTAAPAGEYVVSQTLRDKILAGKTAEAPKARRGYLKFAEKMNLRQPWKSFGPVSMLATANIAVWSHNAGVVADHFGWFRDKPQPGATASIALAPVSKGQLLHYGANGTDVLYAPSDGYLLTPKTSTGAAVLSHTNKTPDQSGCAGGASWFGAGSSGIPYITSLGSQPCYTGSASGQAGKEKWDVAYTPTDPMPRTTAPAGATSGVSPAAPAAQSPSTFAGKRDSVLAGTLSDEEGRAVNDAINEAGEDPYSPFVARVTVPNCTGDLYAACAAKIEAEELVPVRTTLTPAQADLEKPADAVVTTSPAPNTQVDEGATVTVTANPGPETMPKAVPAPGAQETWTAYRERLQAEGLVGTATVLTDTTLDPTKGPGVVVSVAPEPGTRVAPGSTVTTRVNPDTAPTPTAGSGGAFTPPAVPPVDFTPLMGIGACTNFPFGVPCWIYETIADFVGGPVTPSWDFHFPMAGDGDNVTVDLEMFEPHMGKVRAIVGILACASMLWLFYGLAFGGAIGGGRDEGSK